jgi:hypothetical protein
LDAFVDDIDEIRTGVFASSAMLVEEGPHPKAVLQLGPEPLVAQLFPEQGIARFWLGHAGQQARCDRGAAGAAIVALLGTAMTSATKTKEGLLGGLILGMLVGGVAGAAAHPLERALALEFDPAMASFRLYDGPLLRWAKRNLHPAV